jgi:hypothetical protein
LQALSEVHKGEEWLSMRILLLIWKKTRHLIHTLSSAMNLHSTHVASDNMGIWGAESSCQYEEVTA